MTKPGRVAVVASVTVGAVGLFVVLMLRPWWQDMAPPALQLPAGLVALALGVGVVLWLQQRPKPARSRNVRRGRLRDRVQRQQNDETE